MMNEHSRRETVRAGTGPGRWPSSWTLVLVAILTGVLSGSRAGAQSAGREWTPEIFDYNRPARLQITEKGQPDEGLPDTRQQELTFRNLRDEEVPLLVTLPEKGKGPFPAVLLVHPLGGNRRQITREMGKALVAEGFACVALDLPMHGDRAEERKAQDLLPDDAKKAYQNVVGSIMDIRQSIDAMSQRKDLNIDKGVPIVGYSLGAWFGTVAGAADRRVSMLVLQGGGTGDEPEHESSGVKNILEALKGDRSLLHQYPTLRPEIAIARFEPRPVLMQNGKKDPYVSQERARNLYRAAKAPKELKWYDAGHLLPEKAARDAVAWIAKNRN